MNKRLLAIAEQIQPGKGMIDVGTDHGYLPSYLAKNGYPGALFASDINTGPLEAAKKTATMAGTSDRICFLLCDGLALCPPDAVDTIVIAGMGGDMIVKILDEAEWCMSEAYHLILQPMTKPEVVRYWLAYNEFGIESETLAEDGPLYQIISARFGGSTRLNDAELFVGRRDLAARTDLYDRQLMEAAARFRKMISGLEIGGDSARLALYREILNELFKMEERQ